MSRHRSRPRSSPQRAAAPLAAAMHPVMGTTALTLATTATTLDRPAVGAAEAPAPAVRTILRSAAGSRVRLGPPVSRGTGPSVTAATLGGAPQTRSTGSRARCDRPKCCHRPRAARRAVDLRDRRRVGHGSFGKWSGQPDDPSPARPLRVASCSPGSSRRLTGRPPRAPDAPSPRPWGPRPGPRHWWAPSAVADQVAAGYTCACDRQR